DGRRTRARGPRQPRRLSYRQPARLRARAARRAQRRLSRGTRRRGAVRARGGRDRRGGPPDERSRRPGRRRARAAGGGRIAWGGGPPAETCRAPPVMHDNSVEARRCARRVRIDSGGVRRVTEPLASRGETMTEFPYVRQPADFSGPVRYAHGPDSYRQPGVPRGTILDYELTASRVFPGTNRRYWVYVPAQYTASEPASLMVFQDGHLYLDPEGEMRVPVVFDNLIHRGEMPVTIGVFIDPGIFAAELEPENRNAEYD